MKIVVDKLDQLLKEAFEAISKMEESSVSSKSSQEQWSKKEILGHLVDSALHNLQRFNEVQFQPQPYKVKRYDQDELVKVNRYQTADSLEILGCFLALNHRIRAVIAQLSDDILSSAIELPNGKVSNLRFLIVDYVNHLENHIRQITRD
ncbi:MAG: DinB family protein [Bacteroidota bacterium]